MGRRAEGQAADRAEEEWEGHSFPVEDKGQAGRESVDRARVGQGSPVDRHLVSLDSRGLRRIEPAYSLGRRDAGGTTNRW